MSEEFKKFTKKLVNWKESNYSPKASDYPQSISVGEKFYKEFQTISGYTSAEAPFWFMEKKGSSGWEYSSTIFYFGGQLIITKPKSGNYTSVAPQLNISKINQDINQEKKQIRFLFQVDDHEYKTDYFPLEQWLKDSTGDKSIAPVLVAHTHPKNYLNKDKYVYTFFSDADVRLLKIPGLYVEAMIAGEYAWFMVKTNNFTEVDSAKLYKPTAEEVFAIENGLSRNGAILSSIVEHLSDSGLIFFYGQLKHSLRQVTKENFKSEIESYQKSKAKLNILKVENKYLSTLSSPNEDENLFENVTFAHDEGLPISMSSKNKLKLDEQIKKRKKFQRDKIIYLVSIALILGAMVASIFYIVLYL